MPHEPYSPLEVAVALSLYACNVRPLERAQRLHEAFDGECDDIHGLFSTLVNQGEFAATELAPPTAYVYVQHALERYGEEARRRVESEMRSFLGDISLKPAE